MNSAHINNNTALNTATLAEASYTCIHLQNLALTNFRNYSHVHLEVDSRPVVLVGDNGAGKTNILEAISLLTPGRGLFRAKLPDMDNIRTQLPWVISAQAYGAQGLVQIGTGRDSEKEDSADKRIVKIDGKIARAHTDLAKFFAVLWITPQMDTLFSEGNSVRRKFLDRLVYSFDSEHASRVNSYDYAMRERNRLLQMGGSDAIWLSALEQKMVEHGIAIAVARKTAIEWLNNAMLLIGSSFPKAHLAITGIVEDALAEDSALVAEEKFRDLLAGNRALDAASGRSLIGIHRCNIEAIHVEKNMPAEHCSTGEQKAILISIILAQARAGANWHGSVPVMLLDEVISHLDAKRRSALFEELAEIGAQAWLTGTDRDIFNELDASFIHIHNGKILQS